jgi:hypothetical protein
MASNIDMDLAAKKAADRQAIADEGLPRGLSRFYRQQVADRDAAHAQRLREDQTQPPVDYIE